MPELTQDAVEKAKFRHEKKMTMEEITAIRQHLHSHAREITRDELVTYLRKEATRIHADLILEKEALRR